MTMTEVCSDMAYKEVYVNCGLMLSLFDIGGKLANQRKRNKDANLPYFLHPD
jgi:hypothetical protein